LACFGRVWVAQDSSGVVTSAILTRNQLRQLTMCGVVWCVSQLKSRVDVDITKDRRAVRRIIAMFGEVGWQNKVNYTYVWDPG